MNQADTNLYITQVRTQATNLTKTYNNLQALKDKYNALDLGNTLVQADIGGDNDGILIADIAAVLGATLAAFDAFMAAGHATNLHKVAIIA